ncbi:DDE-type integrase/transposase/recombinase [Rhodococcus erythropolis]|uniref:DDE-type integrase/transposase/recombinase n=1 Tax=Rhodococcus erythropolis TaxID=1833 RepID=UPI003982B53E
MASRAKCSSRFAGSGSTCGGRSISTGTCSFVLIQKERDGKAATRFFRKILKQQGRLPRVLVTDKLRSYQVAHRNTMSAVEHQQNTYVNNRCENPRSTRPGNANGR